VLPYGTLCKYIDKNIHGRYVQYVWKGSSRGKTHPLLFTHLVISICFLFQNYRSSVLTLTVPVTMHWTSWTRFSIVLTSVRVLYAVQRVLLFVHRFRHLCWNTLLLNHVYFVTVLCFEDRSLVLLLLDGDVYLSFISWWYFGNCIMEAKFQAVYDVFVFRFSILSPTIHCGFVYSVIFSLELVFGFVIYITVDNMLCYSWVNGCF